MPYRNLFWDMFEDLGGRGFGDIEGDSGEGWEDVWVGF